jgi:hypothetical protein
MVAPVSLSAKSAAARMSSPSAQPHAERDEPRQRSVGEGRGHVPVLGDRKIRPGAGGKILQLALHEPCGRRLQEAVISQRAKVGPDAHARILLAGQPASSPGVIAPTSAPASTSRWAMSRSGRRHELLQPCPDAPE